MIDEAALGRALQEAADRFHPPTRGADVILDLAGEQGTPQARPGEEGTPQALDGPHLGAATSTTRARAGRGGPASASSAGGAARPVGRRRPGAWRPTRGQSQVAAVVLLLAVVTAGLVGGLSSSGPSSMSASSTSANPFSVSSPSTTTSGLPQRTAGSPSGVVGGAGASAGQGPSSAGAASSGSASGAAVGSGGGQSAGAVGGVATGAGGQAALAAPSPPAGTGGAGASLVPQGAPGQEAKVIETGTVDLAYAKGRFGTVVGRLNALAVGSGGFVAQEQTSQAGTAPSASATLRIPAASYQAVLAQVERLGRVTSETSTGQDVTAQYVDLQARINALEDTRAQFDAILAKASTIPDILAVESQISDIQSQLEQLQGQQKVLADQTTYATLAVTVSQAGAPSPTTVRTSSGLGQAWRDAVSGFVGGFEAVVRGSGSVVFALLALAVALTLLVIVARLAWTAFRRLLI